MQAHEQTQFLQAVGIFVQKQVEVGIANACEPLQQRIILLEKIIGDMPVPQSGKDGIDGKDGKDGAIPDVDFVMQYLKGACDSYFDNYCAALPKPQDGKNGKDGIDGKDGAPGIDGREGSNGRDGIDGKEGSPGRDGLSVDAESVNEYIRVCVNDAVSRIPVPPAPVSVVGGFINRSGGLFHCFSDGSVMDLGLVVGRDGKDVDPDLVRKTLKELFDKVDKPKDGKDGKNGVDGKDGLGFEDFTVERADSGEIFLVFKRDDDVRRYLLPHIRYLGIWRAGSYKTGNQVTWEGSMWIALRDTETQPGTRDDDWQLCVKKGRDGKQGKDGPQGAAGKDGRNGRDGRDLTQLAFDGTKS